MSSKPGAERDSECGGRGCVRACNIVYNTATNPEMLGLTSMSAIMRCREAEPTSPHRPGGVEGPGDPHSGSCTKSRSDDEKFERHNPKCKIVHERYQL
ncbi:unnamed protein product [Ranitomeya imitator]|uniref:Uncharacterized protein n=1 Tax=Ranitomeya imitator TaxID=111125 RepID=A0ABN9LE05_9NEOB|nr:unnamed protein product [Ranitomeya imitator]